MLICFRRWQNSREITLHSPSGKPIPFWLSASHRNSYKKDHVLLQLHSLTVNKARPYCKEQKSFTPCKKQKTVATKKHERRRQVSSVLDYGQRTCVPCTKKTFVGALCIFKIVTHFMRFSRDCSFTLISVEQNTLKHSFPTSFPLSFLCRWSFNNILAIINIVILLYLAIRIWITLYCFIC